MSTYNSLTTFLEENDNVAAEILSYLSFVELHSLRPVNKTCLQQLVPSYLNHAAPSLVVLGGLDIELDDDSRDNDPAIISSSVNALDFSTMKWYTLPSLPTPRFSSAVCTLLDGRIVVAGGISGFDDSENECANPSCCVEELHFMMGQPDWERGDNIWRGRNSQRGEPSDVVEVFDPSLGTWSKLPPLPEPRAGAKACLNQKGDCVYIIGGSLGMEEERFFTHDVLIYHIPTNAWMDNENHAVVPHMNHSRTEFALSRIEDKGIVVIGGTNRYLWPNAPLTAEFYSFETKRWENLPPPPKSDYDEDVVSKPEQMGCECVALQDGRHVIVQGGMFTEPECYGVVPTGSGNEDDSQTDVWFVCDNLGDEDYDERLKRSFDIDVYDLEDRRWLDDNDAQRFQGIGRALSGTVLFNPIGATVLVGGGNYEFYSESNTQYPSHGSHDDVYILDGPKGKRILLPWSKTLRRQVTAAGVARLSNLSQLAEKHGWKDLCVHAKVELQGMNSAEYNGKRGRISKDLGGGANGRWGVLLEGSKKPISVRAKCLRLVHVRD